MAWNVCFQDFDVEIRLDMVNVLHTSIIRTYN